MTNIHTTKGPDIIRRAEKHVLNECIGLPINWKCLCSRDTCSLKLKDIMDQKTMEDCEKLIKNVIESRHKRVLERQRAK